VAATLLLWTLEAATAFAGYRLAAAGVHVSGAFAKALQNKNVSVAGWVALRQIAERPAIRPTELVEATEMTLGAMSKVLVKLEEKKWLTRKILEQAMTASPKVSGFSLSGRNAAARRRDKKHLVAARLPEYLRDKPGTGYDAGRTAGFRNRRNSGLRSRRAHPRLARQPGGRKHVSGVPGGLLAFWRHPL
jgi:DNA-binding MarR family transcriptional regulator